MGISMLAIGVAKFLFTDVFAKILSATTLSTLAVGSVGAALVAIAAGLIVGILVAYIISLWIDPSGTVVDTDGHPVKGATVTVARAPALVGPFAALNSNSLFIHPNVNPQITDDAGKFAWDVMPGYYRVTASATGCVSPNDGGPTVETSALSVPPPQLGLVLTLSCHVTSQHQFAWFWIVGIAAALLAVVILMLLLRRRRLAVAHRP